MSKIRNNDTLSVVYSSDDKYAQHTGVSMISLLENNRHFINIEIYIIDNKISKENRGKLVIIVDKYNRKLIFIDFSEYIDKLNLDMEWSISISAYARLFISDMLPNNVETVLYYDCDSIILNKLDEIWHENIDGYLLAGVKDTVGNNIKKAVGMELNSDYINSGMLLINLKKWREENILEKFMEFIEIHNGNVMHHDQGVINGTLKGSIKILPLRYNVMTVFYTMKLNDILKYYDIEGEFYSEAEIEEALTNPVFIHFTPGFVLRPWFKGCKHPKKELYLKYLEKSPWKDCKLFNDTSPIQVKVVNWIYRNIPFDISNKIVKTLLR